MRNKTYKQLPVMLLYKKQLPPNIAAYIHNFTQFVRSKTVTAVLISYDLVLVRNGTVIYIVII
jgi:hypothetical protein